MARVKKTAKKRANLDPVAEAALHALSSASSSSSSDDEEVVNVPITTTKKKTSKSFNTAMKSKSRRNLKPLLEEGDEVWAAWWETEKDRKKNHNARWHRGTIRSYREVEESSPYGPTRKYDIDFDVSEEDRISCNYCKLQLLAIFISRLNADVFSFHFCMHRKIILICFSGW